MSHVFCPECGGAVRKAGLHHDRQRYECKECGNKTIYPDRSDDVYFYDDPDAPNLAYVYAQTDGENVIRSVDQLLDAAKVDRSIWDIKQVNTGAWTQHMKLKQADGTEQSVPTQNFKVKITLVRRDPEPVKPPLEAAHIQVDPVGPATVERGALQRIVALPDAQIGYRREVVKGENHYIPLHDRRAMDLGLQILHQTAPDIVIVGGDYLDATNFSQKFHKDPAFQQTTQPAILEGGWWLAQWRAAAPDADFYYLDGNHEERIPESIEQYQAREAYGIRPYTDPQGPPMYSIIRLLGLREHDIEYRGAYPDGRIWLRDDFKAEHGEVTRKGGGKTASAVLDENTVHTLYFHVHRDEYAMETLEVRNGTKKIVATSPGCLCHIDGRVPSKNSQEDWQQGIEIIDLHPDKPALLPQTETIHIHDGHAVYNQQILQGRDPVEQISHDVEWAFC